MAHEVTVDVGGRPLIFESGRMAKQAHGSVLARYGDTVVLATACMDSRPTDKDFLPLTVDYREKAAAEHRLRDRADDPLRQAIRGRSVDPDPR